jgi:ABC-2 type transport system permease protein
LYALFWFALALFINSFGRSSATNAVLLAGCWIALVLVLPSLVNVAVTSIYPMPSRIDEVNAIRSVNLDMRRDGSRLVNEFYQDHPELAPQNGVGDKALTLAFVTIQQELKRRLGEVEDRFNAQLEHQQRIVNRTRFVSPAIVMQETLNTIAASDVSRYQLFRGQAKQFAQSWDATFLPFIYRNAKLTATDYDRIPRFKFVEQSLVTLAMNTLIGLLGLLAPTAVLWWLSVRKLKRKKFAEQN